MNHKELVEALTTLPEQQGYQLMIKYLSEDDRTVPALLQIIENERIDKKNLIQEMNLELSRATVCLGDKKMMKDKGEWIVGQVKIFYNKWERKIRCCFKLEGIK